MITIMNETTAKLIYEAVIDVAKSGANTLPGSLGNPTPPHIDLKKLATDLCDALEIIDARVSSKQQNQQ